MLNLNKKKTEIVLRSVLKFYKNEFNNIITLVLLDGNILSIMTLKLLQKVIPNNVQNSLNTKDKIEILDNKTIPDVMGYDAKPNSIFI